MKIQVLSCQDFFRFAYTQPHKLLKLMDAPEAIIVKEVLPQEKIQQIRDEAFYWGQTSPASWHPLYDNCPDYHRLHDNYPKAHVKQKFHGFYRHGWYPQNKPLFELFSAIFQLKCFLGGFDKNSFINNMPSQNIIARVNVHHYPKGGGYQAEHIDPAGAFARIQTLIIGAQYGKDYMQGGLYVQTNNQRLYLDAYADPGDMIVISPAIRHGVAPIDPNLKYSWQTNDGRWLVLPLFLYSDYAHKDNIKPQQMD